MTPPSPTDSDAELKQLPRAVQNGMSPAAYETWMFLADKEPLTEPYAYKIKQPDITRWLSALKKQWQAEKVAKNRSLCGCPMCEFHCEAFAIQAQLPTDKEQGE